MSTGKKTNEGTSSAFDDAATAEAEAEARSTAEAKAKEDKPAQAKPAPRKASRAKRAPAKDDDAGKSKDAEGAQSSDAAVADRGDAADDAASVEADEAKVTKAKLALTTSIEGDQVLIIPINTSDLSVVAQRLLDNTDNASQVRSFTTPQRGLTAPVEVAKAAGLIE